MSNKKIKIKKEDRSLARMVQLAEKLEVFDGIKVGLCVIGIGTAMTLLSTESARKTAVRFINENYDKFRAKYCIEDAKTIHIGRKYIEIV